MNKKKLEKTPQDSQRTKECLLNLTNCPIA